jgi:hypothetical protein
MTVSIGDLTVAAARGDEELLERLAMMTGLSLRKVAKRLLSLDGRTRLRNVFAAELPLSRESLGVLSVKQARDWQLVPEIARAWSLPSARVEEILESVHGRTLVWRAFDDEETASEDEDEINDFLNQMASEEDPEDEAGDPLADIGVAWSRPRGLAGVLRALGIDVPVRLRSSRFQSVLDSLRSQGVEVCLADDPACAVLDTDASSPGIAMKVRLRRADSAASAALAGSTDRPSGDPSAGWSRLRPLRSFLTQVGLPVSDPWGQEEFSALVEALEVRGYEVASADGSRLTPLHDALPLDAELRVRHDAIAAPPPSLRAAPAGGRASPAVRESVGDYERATLRLELLTASTSPYPPELGYAAQCVEIAVAGLSLEGAEREVLQHVAGALLRSRRDPFVVLNSLVRRLDAEDGEVLLRAYRALGEHDEIDHPLLAEHWAALCRSWSAGAG